MLAPGTHELGPHHGGIRLNTYREGAAKKVGHDLVIAVERWDAQLTVADDGTLSALRLDIDSTSLAVRDGLGGVKSLTEREKRDIAATINAKVLLSQPITLQSESVSTDGGKITVTGGLTIVGATRPVTVTMDVSGDRLTGSASVVQTEWGIKPYKAFMGALKVRDEVEISVDVRVPAA